MAQKNAEAKAIGQIASAMEKIPVKQRLWLLGAGDVCVEATKAAPRVARILAGLPATSRERVASLFAGQIGEALGRDHGNGDTAQA